MKILIVEDDKWFAESLASVFDEEAKIVGDGDTAVRVVDDWQPDVLLVDVMLGAKNGLTLLYELQSYVDTRQIPVVLMSVEGGRLRPDDLIGLGVVAVLDKTTLTPEKLREAVNVK